MTAGKLLENKYVLFKTTKSDEIYWNEEACGYTSNFLEAGIYNIDFIKALGIKVLEYHEVRSGEHLLRTHYATTLKDAIKLLK